MGSCAPTSFVYVFIIAPGEERKIGVLLGR